MGVPTNFRQWRSIFAFDDDGVGVTQDAVEDGGGVLSLLKICDQCL
jgi:hypothetical protein